METIDLTFAYENGQRAGNPARHPTVSLRAMGTIEKDGLNTSSILVGTHTGTHMDAPRHFVADGATIDQMDISICIGDVTVVNFFHKKKGSCVTEEDVQCLTIKPRMLFVFGWSRYYGTDTYQSDWPYFSVDAVRFLAERGVKLILMDTPSPDPQAGVLAEDFPVHKQMLSRGFPTFVETLANTEQIDFQKTYYVAALPLKVKGLDGAPCRVVLIENSTT